MGQSEDRAAERAHGGIVHRGGDMVALGDGSQWWLNGTPWARVEADALTISPSRPQAAIHAHARTERHAHR